MWNVYEIWAAGKVYVGCTKNLANRMGVHRYQKKIFVVMDHKLVVVGAFGNRDEAHTAEAALIQKYDATNPEHGYNRRFGGNNYGFPEYVKEAMIERLNRPMKEGCPHPCLGKKLSEETKEKIRKKALARDPSTFEKNRYKTQEQLEKLWAGRDAAYKLRKKSR